LRRFRALRGWIVGGSAALGVAAFIAIQPPATLTASETDRFMADLMQLPLIVYDSPARVEQWRRRCSAALHPPTSRQRQAVASLVALVKKRPDHRPVADASRSPATVTAIVAIHADHIVTCRHHVPTIPRGWGVIAGELRHAAG
jgi:hypothetical protein